MTTNNPWEHKALIETAERIADSEGFSLGTDRNFNNKICLFTKGAHEHGFHKKVLAAFDDWQGVIHFMSGWKKRSLAIAVKVSRPKKKERLKTDSEDNAMKIVEEGG